ncbi:hypothetical protein [Nesterenkonia pannonica]|uniref:hypothetical protein n=1 Tax=Nesterenkonia pannonica TaxID=1548602 RepID=UPI002164462F|nr:hypothetical protein [Nesterenkonia pannonica]
MNILRRINDAGTTVIMATHDRAIVDSMSRRVVQLHRGELVRDEQPGTYDPPVGSRAWRALVAEESSSGLRAQDPIPLRTEAVPTVAEQDPAASEPSATSAPSAEEADPAARPEAIYRVTWPGDDTDDEHFQERVLPEEDVEPDTAPNPGRRRTHPKNQRPQPRSVPTHRASAGSAAEPTKPQAAPRGAAAESEESERFSFRRDPGGSNDA